MSLTTKQKEKNNSIIENWTNGNKKDAAKMVKSLTKVQAVTLLLEWHTLEAGMLHLCCNQDAIYNFERFILLALEGHYD